MESELHKQLKERAVKYLWDKAYHIAKAEVECGYYGRYDAWGITTGIEHRTMGIEVKVSRADWRNNRYKEYKAFESGWPGAEENYILCPEGLIRPEEIHPKLGLLWFNGNRLRNKKKPEFIKMVEKAKLEIIIGFLMPKSLIN